MAANVRPPLTDSPWYWALVFALFALALLILFGDKVRQRQTQIERKFQAKELREVTPSENSLPEAKEYSSPERLLIPLWPLAILLVAVAILSGVMLYRGRGRPGSLHEESLPQ